MTGDVHLYWPAAATAPPPHQPRDINTLQQYKYCYSNQTTAGGIKKQAICSSYVVSQQQVRANTNGGHFLKKYVGTRNDAINVGNETATQKTILLPLRPVRDQKRSGKHIQDSSTSTTSERSFLSFLGCKSISILPHENWDRTSR